MTTIAGDVRAGVLVCDSRLNMDDGHMPCAKVVRIEDSLVGGAGESYEDAIFMEWLRAGGGGKTGLPKSSTYAALVLNPRGLFYFDSTGTPHACDRGFHAIGSGGLAATALMIAGIDAVRAVGIACEVDLCSGPPIVTHHLCEPKEKA